ncbi:MAG: Hpt domain-containing protein [Sulfurimonas sp.]|uniref:Hpt domain-containing protein n=1 Tax=Sulfurimonas sp. TaxID=2022749 RepID=UPI00260AEBC6|nr:Hpt domain-containing protein [Sulfurimonas sp.]MDD2652462.1 Hpt domain-containing protein [Sulfurimonas sp.]MDD3452198.1 Hpt domain-containing protein [Sulfurimonas sp.]
MLIYNHKKEFVGIDESSLKAIGFSSIADMRTEAADFADLFTKTPGYIHNFKHVHWIDYIACNDSGMDAKAIIGARDKKFTANIAIKTIYLADNPAQKAFIVELINLRPLSGAQEAQIIATAPMQKVTPRNVTPLKKEPVYESLSPNIIKDSYEDTTYEPTPEIQNKPRNIKIEIDDLLAETPVVLKPELPAQESRKEPLPEVKQALAEENPFDSYIFDPNVASHDLGLPLDLVEEFVQDFIAQANSFKNDLYSSLANGNMDALKSQSHKLKGVAANLRIEDALDALKIINTSHDEYEIKTNLDRFYKIINKLSKNETSDVVIEKAPIETAETDTLILSFKDEPLTTQLNQINDADVPDTIEIPELADDDFFSSSTLSEDANSVDLSVHEESLEKDESPKVVIHYDKKKIAHEIGLDLESFNELFEDYLAETSEIIKEMDKAIQKGDLSGSKSAAIKIKGMSDNMRIHEFDTYLEGIINAKDDEQIKDLVAQTIATLTLISKTEGK